MFFARNDYADKALRLNTSQMEMIWEGSQSLGNVADIFTGVLYHHYVPPPGFCFDSFCSDPPIMVTRVYLCCACDVHVVCALFVFFYELMLEQEIIIE